MQQAERNDALQQRSASLHLDIFAATTDPVEQG
jgi:hypothetical protein